MASVARTSVLVASERSMGKRAHGFRLIEIAIVLVIVGLLLSEVVKGQEMISSARVHNLIAQQDGIKAAFFGFEDRYRALPGDYAAARTTINCTPGPCVDGKRANKHARTRIPSVNYTLHSELQPARFERSQSGNSGWRLRALLSDCAVLLHPLPPCFDGVGRGKKVALRKHRRLARYAHFQGGTRAGCSLAARH